MKIFLTIIFMLFAQTSFAQRISDCSIIYDEPAFQAKFGHVETDLYNFVIDELVDIIVNTDHIDPEKLKMNFKIDTQGKVLSVEFSKIILSEKCRLKLNKKCF